MPLERSLAQRKKLGKEKASLRSREDEAPLAKRQGSADREVEVLPKVETKPSQV